MTPELKKEFENKFIHIDNPEEEASSWRWKNIHFLEIIEFIDNRIKETKEALHILGEAWRGDWSDLDGRTLRDQLKEVCQILDGTRTVSEFMDNNGIVEDEKYKGIYKWRD